MPFAAHRLQRIRHSAAPGRAAAAVAGVIALVLLARLVITVASPARLPLPAMGATAAAPEAARVPISDWHLFGTAGTSVRATTLEALLKGAVAVADPAGGTAFFSDAGGADRGYRVGESLPGGSVLTAVYPDRIELLHQGQRQVLLLSGASGDAGAEPMATDTASATDPAGPRVDPVLRSGQMLGLSLAFADPVLREQLGLRPDDLVTSVDGRDANDPALAGQLQARLARGEALQLGLRRGGEDFTLDLAARTP